MHYENDRHLRGQRTPEHQEEINTLRANRNLERTKQFEQAMFDQSSRYLILVLTLNYKEQYRNHMTLSDLRRDRDHLFRNKRTNELLRAINGYVWSIEEGETCSGLHMHLIIFYDRAYRSDILIAQKIGEYWATTVTNGRGGYWNSNRHKESFASKWGDATGQVNRNDPSKRESLGKVLGYLAKSEQHVTSRDSPHSKMFGTSRFPKQRV